MSNKPLLSSSLQSRVVALPENRQLDVLAALFERRQARVIRLPLVNIEDTPDQESIALWLRQFIASPPDYFIILTGEGLRRLVSAASRLLVRAAFITALSRVRKICRGPKPVKALKEIGLDAELQASVPTTEGIITTLQSMHLVNCEVAVQLYGEEPNLRLLEFIQGCQGVKCTSVAPYVYAAALENTAVKHFIERLADKEVDLIAFTSKSQVTRLFQIAGQTGMVNALVLGLKHTHIGAVGPVVRAELESRGIAVSLMPESAFFMKPLVRAAEALFSG